MFVSRFLALCILLCSLLLPLAMPAEAVTITYGPLAAPQDPLEGGYPTSVKLIWWTDTAAANNTAYVGTTPSGPWMFTGTDSNTSTRHEVLISGLTADEGYCAYVSSDGVNSIVIDFRMGLNLLTNGSFETWHSVAGQDWGTEEPDGWHGWEIFPWTPSGSSNPLHIAIAEDKNTGIPSPLVKDGSHRIGMDEGWRSCYGGVYQTIVGLQPGRYIVSGWAAWLFDGVSGVDQHKVEILAADGPYTAGVVPTGTVIFSRNGSLSDLDWKYVQGTVDCTSGALTIYANLRSDNWDGTSFAHFDGFRVMAVAQPAVRFTNFLANLTVNGDAYDVTISYDTDIPTTTQVQWGPSGSYGSTTPLDPSLVTHHVVQLTNVAPQSNPYHYRAHATADGIDEYSADQTFSASNLPGQTDVGIGLVMVGGSVADGGDDVGPANEVQRMVEADLPAVTSSGLSSYWWPECQPTDPGTGPNVYDWSKGDAKNAEYIPGKAKTSYFSVYGECPSWLTQDTTRYWQKFEEFVEAMTIHMNQLYGDVDFIFDNEPNISRAPSGWNWADWYIHCLQHFYPAVHRADAVTGRTNRVIAGNLCGHSAGGFDTLYSKGLKSISDVLGYHAYPYDIRDGVQVADLATIHSIQVNYGDADKKIFVGEGWGSGRSAGFDRSTPKVEPSAEEIENMWLAMTKGWDNVMTPRTNWDPSYLDGMRFFCGDDNWGMMHWRDRAIPQKDGSGNIIGFIVDGYWMTPDISPQFWNGGMVDWYGNSKDCLIHVLPGNGLVFMNPGFEITSSPPNENLCHFWTTSTTPAPPAVYSVDDTIYHGGSRCLKLTQTASDNNGVWQMTAKRSAVSGVQYRARVWCKTENISDAARFYMRFSNIDGSQKSAQYWADDTTGTTDWRQVDVVAAAPSYTSRIEVGCYLNGTGTAWFDDVTISMADQDQFGSIRGYTLDENQTPVPNSIVRTTTGGYQAVSDSKGYYTIEHVAAGTYDVICRKSGYVPHRVKDQTVAPERVTFASFNMGVPKPGLTVTQVLSSQSTVTGNDTPVDVTVTISNSKPYPVVISDVGVFVEQDGQDATGTFDIQASASNPKTVPANTASQFSFTLTPLTAAEGHLFSVNAYAFGQEDRPNLLINGDLDLDSDFTHWGLSGATTVCNWEMDSADYYSSPHSLRNFAYESSGDMKFNWAGNYSAWRAAAPPAKPDQNYIVGAYHKDITSGAMNLLLFIEEFYYDGANWLYNGRHFSAVPHRSAWTDDFMMYKTGNPSQTPGIYAANRLRVSVGSSPGGAGASTTAWWDDVYLKEEGDWLADDRAGTGANLVVAKPVPSLGAAFNEPVDSYVQVSGPILVAGAESFASRFYIEQEDRSAGSAVALKSGTPPPEGTRVVVTGRVGTIDGEKALLDSVMTPLVGGQSSRP